MVIIKALLWIWQLPQNLLALIIILIQGLCYKVSINGIPIYGHLIGYFNGNNTNADWGVSLGSYILFNSVNIDIVAQHHEYGHTRQSLIFGPLYLIIIGLPSMIMNRMSLYSLLKGSGKFNSNYYNRWPESWADKLGSVSVKNGIRSV